MENNNYIVAIDLGSSNVAVTVGGRDASGKVVIEDIVVKESQGVSRGEVKNVELAAQSIREAVSEIENRLGIKVTEAYTGISGAHIKCAKHPYYVYVSGKDGEISEEDVVRLNESMRNVQAPDGYKLLHMIPQHYIVNEDEEVANPVGMFGKTLGSTFNLIIGEKNIVSRLNKAFQKVGIGIPKLYINPLVSAEAVTFPDEKDLGVAVIDLGAGTSDICIFQDGIVRYLGVIPMGADTINKDIRSFGIMERYVEELKIKYGCAQASVVDSDKLIKVPGRTPHDHKEISFRNLASIIEARLNDIVDYIVEEIKASGYEGKLGAGIILTGGGAGVKEIKALVEDRTGLEVRIAYPDIVVEEQSKTKVADFRAAAAVGILYAALAERAPGIYTAMKRDNAPQVVKDQEAAISYKAHDKESRTPSDNKVEADAGSVRHESVDPFIEDDAEEIRKSKRSSKEDKKGKGIFQKLKEKFEKTFDFDVLDDADDL